MRSDPDNLNIQVCCAHLGLLCLKTNRFAEATMWNQHALEIATRHHGAESSTVCSAYDCVSVYETIAGV